MFATEDHSRDIGVSGYYSYTGYGLELKTAYTVSVLDIYATLNGCNATWRIPFNENKSATEDDSRIFFF